MQNKHLLKKSGLVYHLLALWKFTFPCYTSQIDKSNIFFFEKGVSTLIPKSRFHFLSFIFFQIVFTIFSSSSDASTYYQIETRSYYIMVAGRNLEASINHHSSSNF